MNTRGNVEGIKMQKPGKTGFLNMAPPRGLASWHPCHLPLLCSGRFAHQIGNPADLSNLRIRIIFK
jgi:hypothetical protein